ncbi:type II secretion system protein GspL [Yersinia nurmii]|uniref:Type II secretion system protein L n=1 Tax=Yersinia nurmii TaxID=685706 RepID=A0AAW7K1T9_9GAMM|nr:type II secretion system protein GspL [Yersinia nurmii]MDN0086069.1 type II secretion system protein GspL [Yersinia nurmii]CND86133.1 general secretion pathway protein L [Yersinia nurmii]
MSESLNLFFPLGEAQPIKWRRDSDTPLVPETDGEWISPQAAQDMLTQWPKFDAIRVFFPGEWAGVRQVELPRVSRKQAEKIIPALLEEDLCEDIDDLHFSILKIDEKLATVAVINHQKMQHLTQWLHQGEILATTLLPDWLALPEGHLLVSGERCLLRTKQWQGWSAESSLAPYLLKAQLRDSDSVSQLGVYGELPMALAAALDSCGIEKTTSETLPAPQTTVVGLLCGRWKPRVNYQKQWERWRPTITSLIVLVGVMTVERLVSLWSVTERAQQTRTVAEESFRHLFPEQRRIVNLRAQLNVALREAENGVAEDELLVILPLIVETLESKGILKQVDVQGMKFDQLRQELHLRLRADDFATFEALRENLATVFSVKQDALLQDNERVTGGMTLKRKQNNAS